MLALRPGPGVADRARFEIFRLVLRESDTLRYVVAMSWIVGLSLSISPCVALGGIKGGQMVPSHLGGPILSFIALTIIACLSLAILSHLTFEVVIRAACSAAGSLATANLEHSGVQRPRTGSRVVIAVFSEIAEARSNTQELLTQLIDTAFRESAPGELEVISRRRLPSARSLFVNGLGAVMLSIVWLTAGQAFAVDKVPIVAGVLLLMWNTSGLTEMGLLRFRRIVADPSGLTLRSPFRAYKFPSDETSLLIVVTHWAPMRAWVMLTHGERFLRFPASGKGLFHLLATSRIAVDQRNRFELD